MNTNVWFTSDNHFSHKNIQKFCPNTRRGRDVQHMNELMVEAWNAKVPQNGTVWCLGDFSFGTQEDTLNYLLRLNGTKHFVFGNHDKVVRNNVAVQKHFETLQEYKEISMGETKGSKIKIIMSHYPIREWNHMHHGAYHLFGHVHATLDDKVWGRSMDVGVDARPGADMEPWSWEEIHSILKDRETLPHHGGFRTT